MSRSCFRSLLFASMIACVWARSAQTDSATPVLQMKRKLNTSSPLFQCKEAVAYALKHNPELATMKVAIAVAKQRLRGLGIFPTNPELEAVGKIKAKPDNDKVKVEPNKVELELTWKFPIGGRWSREQQWAKATLQRIQAEVRATQIHVALKVQKFCYALHIAQQKYELYETLNHFYVRILNLVEQRKRSGVATILDYNLAKMESLRNQADLALAQMDFRLQQQKLAEAMGWTQTSLPQIQGSFSTVLRRPFSLPQLLQQAQQHYLLRVVQGQLQEAEKALAFEHAKAIPDLKLKLFYSIEDGFNHTIGAGFMMPIPFLWRNQSKIWSSRAKIQQARLKFRATQFKIQQRVNQSYLQFRTALQVFQLYEQQLLPTFRQQLQLTEKGLRLGSFTILQVMSTQQSVNKALLQRIATLKQALSAYIALQYAVGDTFSL